MPTLDDTLLDPARPPRSRETLDAVEVHGWLRARLPALAAVDAPPEVLQFPGGASNLTYLLRYPALELVLRRPPFGHRARSAHDMLREARLVSALRPVYPAVPAVVAMCASTPEAPGPLGCDFYVMERLRGVILRSELPPALGLTPESTRTLCLRALDKLIELHAVDWQAAGLDALGRGEGYIARQIEGWTRRFRDARTPDVPDFEGVMAWLAARQPPEVSICLIHNDFRFDNLVLAPGDASDAPAIVGVLDWELATLGDPLMDLGNSLAYWVRDDDEPGFRAMRRQPTHAPGMLTRDEVVAYYLARTGRTLPEGTDFTFYTVYGLFRLAGIIQQIYQRFVQGNAQNPQFAMFGPLVGVLEARCLRLIDAAAPSARAPGADPA